MITDLTKEKAKQLDELFKSMLAYKGTERMQGHVPVNEVAKTIDSLKDKDEAYISDLLYIVREVQKDVPTLFFGTTMLQLQRTSIHNFSRAGGFTAIYKKQQKEKIIERVTIMGVMVAMITGVFSAYFGYKQYFKEDVTPLYKQSELQVKSKTTIDTTKQPPIFEGKSSMKKSVSKSDTTKSQ